jgi:hypothetical protein
MGERLGPIPLNVTGQLVLKRIEEFRLNRVKRERPSKLGKGNQRPSETLSTSPEVKSMAQSQVLFLFIITPHVDRIDMTYSYIYSILSKAACQRKFYSERRS